MSTCCCCCCCWDAVGVPDDSPRITGGPGCSGPPPLCIFLPGAAADRNLLSSGPANLTRQSTSCCSSILVRPLNAACLLELTALQRTAPVRWPRTTANPKKRSDSGSKQSKKKFLLPLPTNRPEKKFCCCHKNIGYLNVKNVFLSLSSQQATTLAPLSETWLPWPTLFRRAAPCPTSGTTQAAHDATRKHFRVRSNHPNHGEKLRKSHFFPYDIRPCALAQQRTRHDFDRLTSLSAKLSRGAVT